MRNRAIGTRLFIGLGLAVSLALAFFISPLASSNPDGLEKIASDKKLDSQVSDHALSNGPLADYSVKGVGDSRLATGVSGVIGTVATLGIGWGLFAVVKRSRRRTVAAPGAGGASARPA